MRRRLFERLEQAVERLLRQHVHFVDDVDLVARRRRGIAHAFDDLADIVDAGARGGVHLLHVDMAALGDGDAGLAHAAGMDGRRRALAVRADAVQRARDDARRRRLAHAAHAGEHEGMGDAPGRERVGERLDQRLLPDQAGEILRAVFARQNAIGLRSARVACRRGRDRVPDPWCDYSKAQRAVARIRGDCLWKGGSRRPAPDSVWLLRSGLTRLASGAPADFRAGI